MTKYEYLAELEKNLDMLSYDDKNQAMEYYENYFEDAGRENVQQVIEQLGSPVELAKSIFNGVPGVLANLPPIKNSNGEYNRDTIKSIDAKFGVCRVLVEEGEEFNVEQKNMGTNKVDIKISKDGVLSITNKENLIGIFSGISFKKNNLCPTVIITLPRNLFLDNLVVDMGGGSFEARTINLTSKSTRLTVGAGQIVLKDLTSTQTELNCGMGSIDIQGKLTNRINAECGMGSIVATVFGTESDYSYKAQVGLGEVKIGNNTISGLSQYVSSVESENKITANCGMGAIKVNFK